MLTERIPALASGEEIFSLAVGVAVAALETHQGANAAQGKKPHQGIFSKNRALCVGEIWVKYSETHQDRKRSWSKSVVGSALDANGNTLTDANGKSYIWDFETRLTQAVVPGTNGGTTTFKYDPFGRRIQKSGPLGTTNYLYDGRGAKAKIVEEIDSNGSVLARYSQGPLVDEPLADMLLRCRRPGLGHVTKQQQRDARRYLHIRFVWQTNSLHRHTHQPVPIQYTGREFDPETGTFFYRARYYDPSAGRFTGEDPIQFRGGVNFYTYVRNSPVNFLDPTGMSPRTPWKDVSTRPCNIDEYETCANMCGSRGVESCMVQITFKLVRWKDGKSLWKWVDAL